MGRTHEPGEAIFRSIYQKTSNGSNSPAFPPETRLAVLVGEPHKPGPYVIRVKAPSPAQRPSPASPTGEPPSPYSQFAPQ